MSVYIFRLIMHFENKGRMLFRGIGKTDGPTDLPIYEAYPERKDTSRVGR